jgi:DNA-binding NarL/FixJ family response regulator
MSGGRAILFISDTALYPDGLQEMVKSLSDFATVEVVRSFDYLRKQLLPRTNRTRPVVIALALNGSDMEGLLEAHELFENTRLILVLAHADAETIARGHRMRPRFIGYLANGFGEIEDVARKMLRGSHSGTSISQRRLLS